jgi:hypothetical protein
MTKLVLIRKVFIFEGTFSLSKIEDLFRLKSSSMKRFIKKLENGMNRSTE